MRFQETETVELKSIVMDDIKKEIACLMPQFNKKKQFYHARMV